MPSPPRFPDDVTAVIVHYRGVDDLAALLDLLPGGLEVVVVDNSGGDPIAEVVAGRPLVHVVDAGGNVGFARGANLGARHAPRAFLAFVNPDTRPTPDALAALLADLADDPALAAAAPATYAADGVPRGGGGRQPALRSALAMLLGPLAPPGARIWQSPTSRRVYPVEWLSGACLMVRADAFRAAGGFDEHYVLYNEDMALGRRLCAAGWRLALDGRIRVAHAGGGSHADPSDAWRIRGGALGHYVRRELGPVRGRVVQALVVAAYVVQTLAFAVTGRGLAARERLANARGVARADLPMLGRPTPSG